MSTSIEDLVGKLAARDVDEAGLALGELIRRGRPATPALLGALAAPDARVRSLAAEGLGMIGDPAAADPLAAAVADGDEVVRARAATALAYLGDPRGVDAVIRTIDDFHDVLHSDLSLSAYTLARLGPPVVARVVDLLSAEQRRTRVKAAWILGAIATPRAGRDERWAELGRLVEAYDPDSPAGAAAVGEWLARQPAGWEAEA